MKLDKGHICVDIRQEVAPSTHGIIIKLLEGLAEVCHVSSQQCVGIK